MVKQMNYTCKDCKYRKSQSNEGGMMMCEVFNIAVYDKSMPCKYFKYEPEIQAAAYDGF